LATEDADGDDPAILLLLAIIVLGYRSSFAVISLDSIDVDGGRAGTMDLVP
jgi:hypothetical protein